jgi:cytochrome c-type biogenesis protein CcmF
VVVQLQKVAGRNAELGVKENDGILEYITLKAYKFPFINLLWLGTLVMVTGFMISVVRRVQLARRKVTVI